MAAAKWRPCAAASISAARRSRRSSSTRDGEVLGEARRPTPTEGGPAGRRRAMAAALAEAAERPASRPTRSPGRRRLARRRRRGDRRRSRAPQPARLGGQLPARRALSDALGATVRVGNDVDVATDAEFKLGAGKPYDSLLGVFWGTGVGGGLIIDGKRWTGRGAAGEIGHMVVKLGGAQVPLRAARLHGGLRRARGDGGAGPARARRRARRPSCSRSWSSATATG